MLDPMVDSWVSKYVNQCRMLMMICSKIKLTWPRIISNIMDFVVKNDPMGRRRMSTE